MSLPEDVADLKKGQEKLRDVVLEQSAGQAKLEGAVNTLNATVQANLDRHNDEIKVLFASRGEHTDKIEGIRVDYVPKRDFESHKKENRKDHDALTKDVSCMQWKVAKIVGAITLLVFLAGLAAKSMGVWAR